MPQTTEEIARLLESLAEGQDDLGLARRLRDWSHAVEQHGQYRLRADGASIQSEIYQTLEEHIGDIKQAIGSLRDIVYDTHELTQSANQRLDQSETDRADLRSRLVDLASLTEQIRERLVDLAENIAARPSIAETHERLAQIDDHERRLADLEKGGG